MTEREDDYDDEPDYDPSDGPLPNRARHTDPQTSHDAAASFTNQELTELDNRIVTRLAACGWRGATSWELTEMLGIPRVTVSPRLRPLTRMGRVMPTWMRRMAPTGRNGIVWMVTRGKPIDGITPGGRLKRKRKE